MLASVSRSPFSLPVRVSPSIKYFCFYLSLKATCNCLGISYFFLFGCDFSDILGAALTKPLESKDENSEYTPLIVTVCRGEDEEAIIEVMAIRIDSSLGNFQKGNVKARAVIPEAMLSDSDALEPTMAMGTLPPIHCCCLGDKIVIIFRRTGLVYVYEFLGEELQLYGQKNLGQYVIDASIRIGRSLEDKEVVLLLSDTDNAKDGGVATLILSPTLAMC